MIVWGVKGTKVLENYKKCHCRKTNMLNAKWIKPTTFISELLKIRQIAKVAWTKKRSQKLLRRVNRQMQRKNVCPVWIVSSSSEKSSIDPSVFSILQQQRFTSLLFCLLELCVTMAATSAVGSGGRTWQLQRWTTCRQVKDSVRLVSAEQQQRVLIWMILNSSEDIKRLRRNIFKTLSVQSHQETFVISWLLINVLKLALNQIYALKVGASSSPPDITCWAKHLTLLHYEHIRMVFNTTSFRRWARRIFSLLGVCLLEPRLQAWIRPLLELNGNVPPSQVRRLKAFGH